jgi:hypothetical protein
MWNNIRFKSICDELEVTFKPRHKFAADLGGYAERENGAEKLYMHTKWMWDGLQVGLEPQP